MATERYVVKYDTPHPYVLDTSNSERAYYYARSDAQKAAERLNAGTITREGRGRIWK